MNISASKFSSGCESGWTVYLDQSYISETELKRDQNNKSIVVVDGDEDEDEEEDLSMVSDASSGPPHCNEDDREDFLSENASSFRALNWVCNKSAKSKDREVTSKKKKKNNKIMNHDMYTSEYHSCLDDTASSPVSKNKSTLSRKEALMEYSQGFSATHFKGESAFDKHFGILQSSLAKGSASQQPGDFQGGKWK